MNKDNYYKFISPIKEIIEDARNGKMYILVESGGIFFTKLLSRKLVDEIHVFRAPFNIGKLGKPMIINKKIKDLSLVEISKNSFGKDVYHHFAIQR